jgi:hypothetical protein
VIDFEGLARHALVAALEAALLLSKPAQNENNGA